MYNIHVQYIYEYMICSIYEIELVWGVFSILATCTVHASGSKKDNEMNENGGCLVGWLVGWLAGV